MAVLARSSTPGEGPGQPAWEEAAPRFTVLGPVEIMDGRGGRQPITTQFRTVLAVLVLRANRAVPTASLVEELWADDPPPRAVTTVQTYICQLRKLLHPGTLGRPGWTVLTRPAGYLLRVPPGAIDLHRFEDLSMQGRRLAEGGDLEAASTVLSRALRLWRGPALANVEPGPMLRGHVARIEAARMRALELRIEADLRLGRHRELIGELKGLTLTHPLHEWFFERLMLALSRSGRRCEALEVYRRIDWVLHDELGSEPSADLQHLRRRLLRLGS